MTNRKRIKKLAVYNLITALAAIGINYLSQALRFNDTSIGEMSDTYNHLFTPASYAFAIWGLIFIGLLAYGIYQVRRAFFSSECAVFIEQTGYWFVLANALNCFWVLAFVYDLIGLSVVLMLGILVSLIKIIVNTNMERWDAPMPTIVFVWWPICLYSGWIAVAAVANITTFLTKIGWQGYPLSPEAWTILMILAIALLNIFMVVNRNMREFAAVGIWALAAIYVRHQDTYEVIANTALAAGTVLFLAIAWHGYKNRHANPFIQAMNK
ncbi:Membrane protein [Croceitalea dokdonensis DOKDO 023]|uniref:Membrane protein n=1 Tax=Croceitalea dokdonensis DOKDO 023 TaxID=1300341 RepID=A0A0P7AUI1_9FLAO|nr:hypothetical protein [Croceitalea dokdonensis]KPM32163.1 Membrane protein [Croceitalea dokdonensis DOKDO 023]